MSDGTSTDVCVGCARGWQHCHGTWVEHGSGGECTEREDCDSPAEAHVHVVECHEVDRACACR